MQRAVMLSAELLLETPSLMVDDIAKSCKIKRIIPEASTKTTR